ncbi:sigma-70 family RNA polymerase sigma factor [Schleiferilactobacillus harbinensis]|jgi:RNA polymerase sigma-70 factor (ECF subfamily)|uniref:sigma-70 family RNA polymerase sigma factor n=2 Tax=Schleiferilactobacillus harbinensis TaxID=304207 RepID=UPI0039EAC9CE
MMIVTEYGLVQRAQAGDRAALGDLLIAHQTQMYRMAYLYVHNEADALDVVQETALQATKSIRKLRQPEYFKTWLLRILINVAKQQIRAKPPAPLPASEAIYQPDLARRQDLLQLLAGLPENRRLPIVLFYYNGLTLKEISAVLHIPVGTVKSRMNRGLTQLRVEGGKLNAQQN